MKENECLEVYYLKLCVASCKQGAFIQVEFMAQRSGIAPVDENMCIRQVKGRNCVESKRDSLLFCRALVIENNLRVFSQMSPDDVSTHLI